MDANTRPLYLVLGIPSDASAEEIRRAYRRLALKYHPDKAGANNAEAAEKFQQILAAYTLLSDPEARQVYDRYGEQGLTNIESVPVMAEVAHIMCAVLFFRVTFAVMAVLSVLGFICCLLVALKVDYNKKWSWVVVAIPAFAAGIIILAVVIISMCLRVKKYRSWYMATKQCPYYNNKSSDNKSHNEDGEEEMGQNNGTQNRNSKSKAGRGGGGEKGGVGGGCYAVPTCICNFNNILPSGTTGTQCTCGAYAAAAAAKKKQQQQQQQQHNSAGQTASDTGKHTSKGSSCSGFFGFGASKKSCNGNINNNNEASNRKTNNNGEGPQADPSTPLTPAAGSPDDLCRPACAINKCLIVQQVTFWVRHISILCTLVTFVMLAEVLQKELNGEKSPLSWGAVFGPVFIGSILSVVSVGQFRDVLRLRGVHEMCSWMLGIMNFIGFAMFGMRMIQVIILPLQLEGVIHWRPILVGLPSIVYVSLRCILCVCLEVSRVRGLERFRARNNPLEKQDCATTNLTTGETRERPEHKKDKKNKNNNRDSSDVRRSGAVVAEDHNDVSGGSGRTQQHSSGSNSDKMNPPQAPKSSRKKRGHATAERHTATVEIDEGASGSVDGSRKPHPNNRDEKRDTELDDEAEEEVEEEEAKPYVSAYKQPSFIIQTTLEIIVHVLIVASIVMCVLKANGCETISMTAALAPLYVLFAILAIVATTLYTCFAIYVSSVKADEKKKRAEAEREQIRREREARKEKKRRERENFAAPQGPFGFNPQAWNSRHRPRHYSHDNLNNNNNHNNSFTTNSNSNGNSHFYFYNNNNNNNNPKNKNVNDAANSASEAEGGGHWRKVSTAGHTSSSRGAGGGGGGGSYSSFGGPTQSFFVPSLSTDGAFEEEGRGRGRGDGSNTPSGLYFGASGDENYNNHLNQRNQRMPRGGRTSYNNAVELDDDSSQGQEMYSARHMDGHHSSDGVMFGDNDRAMMNYDRFSIRGVYYPNSGSLSSPAGAEGQMYYEQHHEGQDQEQEQGPRSAQSLSPVYPSSNNNNNNNNNVPTTNDSVYVNNPMSTSMSAYGNGGNGNGMRQKDAGRINAETATIAARGSLAPTASETATPHTPRKQGFSGFDGEYFTDEAQQQQQQIFTEEPLAQWEGRRRASLSVTPPLPLLAPPQHQLKEHEQEGEGEVASLRAPSSEGAASPSEYDSLLSEENRVVGAGGGGSGAEPRKKEESRGGRRSVNQFMYEDKNENPLFAGRVSPPLSYSSATRRHDASFTHTNNNLAAQQEIPSILFGEPTARLSVYKRGGANASVGFGHQSIGLGVVGPSLAESRGTATFNNSFLSDVSPLTPPHVK